MMPWGRDEEYFNSGNQRKGRVQITIAFTC